jgi:hypothetical protein
MSIPLDKIWQVSANNVVPLSVGSGTQAERAYRTVKNAFVGFASGGWDVWYSCNGTVAGTAGDGVDRWSSDSDIKFAGSGSPRSWIVLKNRTTGAQLLVTCGQGKGQLWNFAGNGFVISPSVGFTGGTTTTPPATPSDAIVNDIAGGVIYWVDGISVSSQSVVNIWQSTDGQCARHMSLDSGFVLAQFMNYDTLKFPSFSPPTLIGGIGVGGGGSPAKLAGSIVNWYPGSNYDPIWARGPTGSLEDGQPVQFGVTEEGFVTSVYQPVGIAVPVASDLTGAFPLGPLGVTGLNAGSIGRHGQLFDLWVGSAGVNTGDTYPNDTSRQFAQFDDFVWPWEGSVPVIA